MEQLFDILRDLFSAGFGIWNLVLFFQYRRLKKARVTADTRDVWQEIAESNNTALLKQNNEIRRLREALSKMERMLYDLISCKHYDHCPIRHKLQEFKTKLRNEQTGQSPVEQKGYRYPRDDTSIDSPDGDP